MVFLAKILGYRDFNKLQELKDDIAKTEGLTKSEVDNIQGFVFFDTNRQKTWLLGSPNYLYCILDDITTDNFEVRWKMSAEDISSESATNVKEFLQVNPNFKENSGRISFGRFHKGWLYSKKLFPDTKDLMENFQALVQRIASSSSKNG